MSDPRQSEPRTSWSISVGALFAVVWLPLIGIPFAGDVLTHWGA